MKLWRMSILGTALLVYSLAHCFAQSAPVPGKAETAAGVVVEKLDKYSEGEKAGLVEGDVLMQWARGDASGRLYSPFDLMTAEIEQAPRGNVTVQGFRGKEKRSWILGPDAWGIETRPNFSGAVLDAYREAVALAGEGKLSEAAERWRSTAVLAAGSDSSSSTWLWFHVADKQAQARSWSDSDPAFARAAESISPESEKVVHLQRAWGKSFRQRSDWVSAEEHYRQGLNAADKAGDSLTRAVILDDLGDIDYYRGALAQAADLYEQALHIREKLAPQSLALAVSLNNLGDVDFARSDFRKSEERHAAALEIQKRLAPGSLPFAASLQKLGRATSEQGDLDRAEEFHRQSLLIREKLAPESMELASSLNSLANIAYSRGDLAQCEALYLRSLGIRQKLAPGSLDVAGSLTNLGNVMDDRGDLKKSQEFYLQSLAINEKLAPGSLRVADILNNLGFLAVDRDDLAEAEVYHRRALEIQQKLAPESLWVARSFNNLGRVAERRGDYERAREYFLRSLTLKEKVSPGSLDVATCLDNLGFLAAKENDLDKAEAYDLQALAIRQKRAPNSLATARNFNNLGIVMQQRGNLAKAEQYEMQALAIREKLAPTGVDLAANLLSLANLVRQQGDLARAEQYYRESIAIWDQLAPSNTGQAEALGGLASIMRQRGQGDAAAEFYERALDALEGQTSRLGGTEQTRAAFRGKHEKYYQEYLDLLVAQGKNDLALQVLERSRARTFLEILESAHLQIHRGAGPELLEKERSLREKIIGRANNRLRLLGGKHQPQQIADLDLELAELRERYAAVETEIQNEFPNYAALTQPQHLTTEQIRELLGPETVLLEYSLGEEHSYVFAVTPRSISVHMLPAREEIEVPARGMYKALTARKQRAAGESATMRQAGWRAADARYAKFAARLSEMVLGPVAAETKGKRLAVISDGTLQYVPFAALPDPTAAVPLMATHEIVNLPSASVLSVLRRQDKERRPATKTVVVLADPVFTTRDGRLRGDSQAELAASRRPALDSPPASADGSTEFLLTRSVRDVGLTALARLPFTRREAEAIISMTPAGQGKQALDFEANLQLATSQELSQYRIVHFATHGLLDSRRPELSGLVLSLVDKHGASRNGFLSLEDIYNLDLRADLVVLSACETGLGKEISGEGLIGLTRGFMYAGASRVVASLWNVSDVATAELMRYFYQGMLREHLPPAAALQRAQVRLLKQPRWKSPYYWAAFQIQGDWN